jgi:hypothetical protein
MKNKIILTLVLLIPSLCFGESVMFAVIHEPEKEMLIFVIESTSYSKKVINFKLHKTTMFFADNGDSIKELSSLTKTLFPNIATGLRRGSVFKNDKSVNVHTMMLCVPYIAMADNYALTNRKELSVNADIFYLYKQDK